MGHRFSAEQNVSRFAAAQSADGLAAAESCNRSVAEDPGCTADARKEDPAHGPIDADRYEATLGA